MYNLNNLMPTSSALRSIGEAVGFSFIFLKFCTVLLTLFCTPLMVPWRLMIAPLLLCISSLPSSLDNNALVLDSGTSNEAITSCIQQHVKI